MPQGIYPRPLPEERFWAKVHKTDTCWLWTGATPPTDYAHLYINGVYVYVHRFAYELLIGPIPDHVWANGCTSTLCVKAIANEYGPAHLEVATVRENILRGNGVPARNARKTHCVRGHLLAGDNLYVTPGGGRICKACRRENSRRYKERKKALHPEVGWGASQEIRRTRHGPT